MHVCMSGYINVEKTISLAMYDLTLSKAILWHEMSLYPQQSHYIVSTQQCIYVCRCNACIVLHV